MKTPTKQLFTLITGNCNSRCIHCTYWENKESLFLDLDTFKRTVEGLEKEGLENVMLSGGEPLLHPYFEEFINYLSKKNLQIKLTTNGIFLFRKSKDILSKIDEFTISMDSCSRKMYQELRGVDKFNDVLKSLEKLKNMGKKVKCSFFIQKYNYQKLPHFIDFCDDMGIDEVSFLVPNKDGDFNSRSSKMYKRILLDEKEIEEFEKEIIPQLKEKLTSYQIKVNHSPNSLLFLVKYFNCFNNNWNCEPLRTRKCSVPINSIVLTEKGRLKPCLFMPYEYENHFVDENKSSMEHSKFKQEYLFRKELFQKHCIFCLEVPLEEK